MSDIINNFINSINVDEELKKIQTDVAAQESNNAEQLTQAKMSNMDVVADTAASAATGAAKGLTYVIDLPFYNGEIIELAVKMGSLDKYHTEKQAERTCSNYWNFMAYMVLDMKIKQDQTNILDI